MKMHKKILLVEPDFPIPAKSKNHSNFLPIGLLKLASYYRKKRDIVKLNRGNKPAFFTPDKIIITTLFTYWAKYVKNTVEYYRKKYPSAFIEVGGIYATLMPKHCKKYTACDKVFIGQHKGAEKCLPAYNLVDVDYQIIHGMRGCPNTCLFCGIWRIEQQSYKTSEEIRKEICSNNLIFYDNNMLINPHIDNILTMLAYTTHNKKVLRCECQSGFDGRVLMEKPYLANMLKLARFKNIRLAWDFPYTQKNAKMVSGWIDLLENAGYKRKDIYVFMIYNWNYSPEQLFKKREQCFKWEVQISDCRYRPLNQISDNYNPRSTEQTSKDYFIHPGWTDAQIREFRRHVRQHNICIRHRIDWNAYDSALERENSRKREISLVNA